MEIYRLVFSPIRVNTYILASKSGDCVIIDCSCYNNKECDQLLKFISDKNLKPVLLLNTHSHFDHIFGNGFLHEKFNLLPLAGELDEINRTNAPQHAALFSLKMPPPPAPGGFLANRQIIQFGTSELMALHVPGHSPGSYAFYSEKDECIFAGDTLFSGSIGRTDLVGGNFETLIESITSQLFTLPPLTVVYPGHGSETTIEKEIRTNPFFNR